MRWLAKIGATIIKYQTVIMLVVAGLNVSAAASAAEQGDVAAAALGAYVAAVLTSVAFLRRNEVH